jgi:hypothetical protein
MTFSNANLAPKLIKCLFVFIDEIWYYKFHRVDYPITVKIFM